MAIRAALHGSPPLTTSHAHFAAASGIPALPFPTPAADFSLMYIVAPPQLLALYKVFVFTELMGGSH